MQPEGAISDSPFGMIMPGRSYDEGYRYGFNGMEINEELASGSSYDFGARMYDARIGRWMSTDAYEPKYPYLSPYHFAGGNPILFVDSDGNDFYVFGDAAEWNSFKTLIEASFDDLVVLERNEEGLVTMNFKEGVDEVEAMLTIEKLNGEAFKVISEAIAHEEDTRIELLSESERTDVAVGWFRGGVLNGKIQSVDLQDAIEIGGLSNAPSTLSLLIHEIKEAYEDQAVNGSPDALSMMAQVFTDVYDNPHNAALQSQAKVNGDVFAFNLGDLDDEGNGTYDFLTGSRDGNGNMQWQVHQVTFENNNPVKGETFRVDVTPDGEGGVESYERH